MAKEEPAVASEWALLTAAPLKGPDHFLVDNSDKEWNALRYLKQWSALSKSFDIATGNFEIGSLLALEGSWHKLETLRILMGDQSRCVPEMHSWKR